MNKLAMSALVAGLAWLTAVRGQEPAKPGDKPDADRRAQVERFGKASPKLGELAPDASAFDAGGKPVRLRELTGHYTVLVFGCLT